MTRQEFKALEAIEAEKACRRECPEDDYNVVQELSEPTRQLQLPREQMLVFRLSLPV